MEPDFEDEFNFKSLSDVKKEFNKNNPQKVSKTKIRKTKKVLSQKTGLWKKVELTISEDEAQTEKELKLKQEKEQNIRKAETKNESRNEPQIEPKVLKLENSFSR